MASLRFYYSCMGGGKSTAAIQLDHSLREAGFNPILVKPSLDTRDVGVVKSRIGIEKSCYLLSPDSFSLDLLGEDRSVTHVICDEAQFLTENQVVQLSLVVDELGVDVHCFGLRTSYLGRLFVGSAALMALADDLVELPMISRDGRKTVMHVRFIDGEPVFHGDPIHVGDIKEDYSSVSRREYFRLKDEFS